jgi:hypothetical protein
LAGIGNNLCIGADVPYSKAGIEHYFRHDVKFNKINGKLRIHTSQGLGQLKSGRSKFRVYLEQQRVYINNAQLGDEDIITLGWTLKSHPAFLYRDDMKESLYKMMGDEFKEVQHALSPKTIKYKRIKDGSSNDYDIVVTFIHHSGPAIFDTIFKASCPSIPTLNIFFVGLQTPLKMPLQNDYPHVRI